MSHRFRRKFVSFCEFHANCLVNTADSGRVVSVSLNIKLDSFIAAALNIHVRVCGVDNIGVDPMRVCRSPSPHNETKVC